jgi:hypothetical protein
MEQSKEQNAKGRQKNAAQPPGDRPGLVSEKGVKRTGEAARRAAGPDGPDAGEIGATFKRDPAQ